MHDDWFRALLGGAIIGAASLMLLAFNGRVFGVSGIVGGALVPKESDTAWRVAAVLGMLVGGVLLAQSYPAAFDAVATRPLALVVAAGLLVGFGTRLGNGCTSGHGICGVSRLSKRSIAATVVFLVAGMMTATLLGYLGVDA